MRHSIWVLGLLASPLFALPAVESRTGEPVIPSRSTPQESASRSAPRSFEPSYSASSAPLSAEDRAAHLTLTQIEALQRELSELRGLVETQEHQIKQLKKGQQDLYVDLESRIKQLQTAGQGSASKVGKPAALAPSNAAVGAGTTAAPRPVSPPPVASTKAAELPPASAKVAPEPPAPLFSEEEVIVPSPMPEAPKTNLKEAKVSGSEAGPSVSTVSPPKSRAAAPSMPASSGEQQAYQAAYNLVRTKRYIEAIASLQQYLSQFPKGENAAAAHYWLGEVYLLQWQNNKGDTTLLDKSSDEFLAVITQFPQHAKVMDATLKLGLIEFDKGNQATAEQYLTDVKTRYPGTTAARLAETRLQQISSD